MKHELRTPMSWIKLWMGSPANAEEGFLHEKSSGEDLDDHIISDQRRLVLASIRHHHDQSGYIQIWESGMARQWICGEQEDRAFHESALCFEHQIPGSSQMYRLNRKLEIWQKKHAFGY